MTSIKSYTLKSGVTFMKYMLLMVLIREQIDKISYINRVLNHKMRRINGEK